MLSAYGLKKSFGEQLVLDDVAVDVVPGNISAILGPSGAGKSTLLRLLACLDAPEAGSISLNGKMLWSAGKVLKGESIWPHVTLVFQQQFLWPHLSLEENLYLPTKGRNAPSALTKDQLLKQLELSHLLKKRPWQLSIGERSRAALMRAFLLNPKFLLLDEITAALDSERRETVGLLLRTFSEMGGGVLLVTHDLEFAAQYSDETLRLERGHLKPIKAVSVEERVAVMGENS